MTEFIVRVTELAEAEIRLLRHGLRNEGRAVHDALVRLGIAAVFLLGAAVFGISGMVAVLGAIFEGLHERIGVPGALGIVGLSSLCLGGAFWWIAKSTASK